MIIKKYPLAILDLNIVQPIFVIYTQHQAFQRVKSSGLYTEQYVVRVFCLFYLFMTNETAAFVQAMFYVLCLRFFGKAPFLLSFKGLCKTREMVVNPLSPHDALKHHFTSL